MLSFFLGGGSVCEDVLSEIALLDKIFKVFTEGPTLRSLVSFAVMEGAIVFRSGTSRVTRFCFQTHHPGLIFDGFENILNQEF